MTDPQPSLQTKSPFQEPTTEQLAPLAATLMAATWNSGLHYDVVTAAADAYDIWEACDERRRHHAARS